jgi:nitrogen fixation protein NifU and related proteins
LATSRFSATTIDHFQHPRNIGRMTDADGFGRVDDATTDTMVSLYVKFSEGVVAVASFRTFGCSACIAASSIATELLVGRARAAMLSAQEVDSALGGLPDDKRYCLDLVVEAARLALAAD